MGFFSNLAAGGAANNTDFTQDERELQGFDSAFDDFGIGDALFDPGNFRSGDISEIVGRHGLSELLGFTQADAARKAAEDLKAATLEGQKRAAAGTERQLGTVGASTDLAQQQLGQGFGAAGDELRGGLGAQQRLLGQAGQSFAPQSALLGGLDAFQQGATAEGRSANLNRIAGGQQFQDLLGSAQRNTGNQLSSAGLRRSGAASTIGNQQFLDTLMGLESEERARTGGLIGLGSQANQQQANILQQQAAAAGAGGGSLANLFQNQGLQQAGLTERGGLTIADIINRGTQADIDLLGQSAQAQAAGTQGAGNALTQGFGQGADLVGGVLGMLSDPSLKTSVSEIGNHNGIPVYEWEWNEKAFDMFGLKGESFGHMADELEKTHPHLVSRDGNGIMRVNYGTDETVRVM